MEKTKTVQRILRSFGATVFLLFLPGGAMAQIIPYKAVFYRPSRASFAAELADDTLPPGASRTPREAAILSLDNDFSLIRNSLRANAVVIALRDDDGFSAQFGGGWPYDPQNRPAPQRAVAQEIILAIANSRGLKVIFSIGFSGYHRFIDDTFPNLPGAWQFIQALIDPTVFYGSPCTTKLGLVGLPNSCVRSYFDDPRVAGWFFDGEWCVTTDGSCDFGIAARDRLMINKYWNYFRSVVHWNGSQTAFDGIFAIAAPDNCGQQSCNETTGAVPKAIIDALKGMFGGATGNQVPQKLGFEWYGNGTYNLLNIAGDLRTLAGWMRNDGGYSVPAGNLMLAWISTEHLFP